MLRSILYWISQKRWLLITVVIITVLYHLPYPETLSRAGYRSILIVFAVVILIIKDAVPLPSIALLIAVLQVSFAIAGPTEVARSYMSDAVFFIMGSLMLAVAIVRQGLDARLTLAILTITWSRLVSIMWGFFIISLLLSSFMGQFTVVAMLLPVALTLIRNAEEDTQDTAGLTKLILFALIYGAILGSIGTPSGGARNAIMISYLADAGPSRLTYWRWMVFAYPVMLAQIPVAGWVLSRTYKSEVSRLDGAVRRLKAKVEESGALSGQQILAIVLFVLVFLAWIFMSDRIGMGIVALAGVFLYLATDLVKWEDINTKTNWGVVLLFAAMISLGTQLRDTGAANWLANHLVGATGNLIEQFAAVQYGIIVVLTTVVVNIMSPAATVAVMGPIFLNFQNDPIMLGMTTAFASSFGYFTVIGAPAAMIVGSTGLLTAKDFLRGAWRMALVSMLFLALAIIFYWPNLI